MCSFSQNWFALSFLVLAIFLSYGELSAGMWFMAVTALKMESVK
jgi:energy-converting hydrogenase Eha subunit E